ncbi:MAG TPA: FAD binding domain-containing protein, partial [Nitrospirota bacterium]|nr:FAD binding domain-containing protein [Nitrospirota bacterium]
DGGLVIGALTTVTEVAENKIIQETYPALAQAAAEVASPQLRNQGTIGGNLCQKPRCWYYRGEFHCLRKGGKLCYAASGENQFHCIFGGGPCYIVHPSDTAPALAAFNALVKTIGPKGTRTVAVDQFHVLPAVSVLRDTVLLAGEIVTGVILPPAKGARSSYRKVRARNSWDFAVAGAAIAMSMEGGAVSKARIFLSGAAPVPWRLKAAEEAITGKRLGPDVIALAADVAVKGAQPLEHNGYKLAIFRGILQEELLKLAKA